MGFYFHFDAFSRQIVFNIEIPTIVYLIGGRASQQALPARACSGLNSLWISRQSKPNRYVRKLLKVIDCVSVIKPKKQYDCKAYL